MLYRGAKAHINSQRYKLVFVHGVYMQQWFSCSIGISLSPVYDCHTINWLQHRHGFTVRRRLYSVHLHLLCCCKFCTHVLLKMSVVVQNPVVTLAWWFGYYQLLAPLISLSIDTKPFCQSPLRCKPMLIICLVFTFCVYFILLVRTEQFVNPLNFYNFSQSFRLQFAGLTLGGVIFYATLVHAFRRVMNRYEQRRLSPL